ncbi:MAG TPA: hemopexin repeat-containing protein, partial [Verrucomicrobiae bacterium]
IDAALNSGEGDYFFSGDQYIRVTRGETGPGAMDAGYPAPISNWGWHAFGASGIDAALQSGFDFTDAITNPSGGLVSNSNYVLADGGKHLTNVTVTVDLYSNLTYSANGAPQPCASSVSGFTFQLNCYSATKETDGWQQYVIGYDGSEIYGQINNWKNLTTSLINQAWNLVRSPAKKAVPAVYKVRIALQNDSNDNVTGVTFSIFDQNGNTVGSKSATLTSISGVSSTDLAPIVAFELNIVGPGNSESVTFSAGNGTITCTADNQLTTLSSVPSYVDVDLITAETSNAAYGTISGTASSYQQQSFNINATQQPQMARKGRTRPPLRPPQNRA